MNFESGTSLAEFQDRLFKQWVTGEHCISEIDNDRLNGNMWVSLAKKLGPNNLVIRHRCLQDMFNGTKEFLEDILNLYKILAPGLWVEGYSYWKYTKPFLSEWGKLYYPNMNDIIKSMDDRFVKTSYIGPDGKLWPAPFGDLRKEPLEDSLQYGLPINCSFLPVSASKRIADKDWIYDIEPYLLGENLHVPTKAEHIHVREGIPKGFRFYEGYDKKYPTKLAEIKDMLKLNRIFSIFKKHS